MIFKGKTAGRLTFKLTKLTIWVWDLRECTEFDEELGPSDGGT